MRLRDMMFVIVVLGGGLALARGTLRPTGSTPLPPEKGAARANLGPIVAKVNAAFERRWTEKRVPIALPQPSWR